MAHKLRSRYFHQSVVAVVSNEGVSNPVKGMVGKLCFIPSVL